MKKKLLAVVLAVVMLAALLVPVLAISAAGPTATISIGTPYKTTRNKNNLEKDVIAIDVVLSGNGDAQGFFTARYKVISEEGLEMYFAPHSVAVKSDKGADVGDYTDGDAALNLTVGQLSEGGKTWFQVVQDSTQPYGIYADGGKLVTVYFVAPTNVGTYNFTLEWMDGTDDTTAKYDMTVGTANATYTVECTSHTPAAAEQTKAPTCEDKGEEVIKCSACGKVIETKEIPALDHDWDSGVAAEGVACGATADVTFTCQREGCGETKKETGAKVDHSWVEDKDAYVAPKCGVAGKKVYKCENANCPVKTKEESVAALEHEWDNGTADASKVCGETADVIYKCTREGCDGEKSVAGTKIEHDWKLDESKCVAAKCEVAGKNVYVCQRANCPEGEKEEAVAALEHIWVEDKAAYEAPTCEDEGAIHYNCSQKDCPKGTKEEAVDALGHDFSGDVVITKKPTADAEGEYTVACVNGCGDVDTVAIAKLAAAVEGDGFKVEAEDAVLPSDIALEAVGTPEIDEDKGMIKVSFVFASEYADLAGEAVITLDAAEFGKVASLAVYAKAADGSLEKVGELKDGKYTFTADLEGEYVLEVVEAKTSPSTGDASNVVVFAVIALIAAAALVVVGKKRFA